MKTLIYPLILLCVSIASASAQTDNYEARMEEILISYDSANNAAGRRVALDSMFTIDKKYLGEAFKKMWAELDEKTATGADCRRVGIAMAAGREKKAHKWCFRKGAELGDPYCANRVLIEQLEELNYPEAAIYLYPKLKATCRSQQISPRPPRTGQVTPNVTNFGRRAINPLPGIHLVFRG